MTDTRNPLDGPFMTAAQLTDSSNEPGYAIKSPVLGYDSEVEQHHPACRCPECHPEVWDEGAGSSDADLMYDGADPMDL
jgi:hypothetical protein